MESVDAPARPDRLRRSPQTTTRLAVLLVAAVLIVGCNAVSFAPRPAPTDVLRLLTEPPATDQPTAGGSSVEGSGAIVFGTGYNTTTLAITGAASSFRTSSTKIGWRASLRRPIGANSVGWLIASIAAGGSETPIVSEQRSVPNPTAGVLANADDLASLVGRRAGLYVMRYEQGTTVLAEGRFRLVP